MPTVSATARWVPRQLGIDAAPTTSVFGEELDDGLDTTVTVAAAAHAATELAAAQARQAELDASYLRGVADGREHGELAGAFQSVN